MSTSFSNKPYTYLLKWDTGAWYYGVRYAKNCTPADLWKTYFTSSKHVKHYVESVGQPSVVQVRRVFETAEGARKWEHRVLRRLKAVRRKDSLNQTDNKSINPLVCSIKKKGKTYEEIYGVERARILRSRRAESNRHRNRITWSDEAKRKAAIRNRGGGNPRALKVCLNLKGNDIIFSTIRDAGVYLSSTLDFKLSTCVGAIRAKLSDPTKTTNRKEFQSLYSSFSASYL